MADARSRKRNPYITCNAINEDEPERFFGRESLFNFIEDNLRQNVKIILLHGQRRIGKSSVLKQIPNFVAKDEFLFVHFDLQHKNRSTLSEILHSLATEIVEHIEPNQDQVNPPSVEDLEADIEILSDKFLPKVYRNLSKKNLVLLLDEFDVLSDDNPDILAKGVGFFPYLHSLTGKQEKLFIIPVVGRNISDLPRLLDLFKRAPTQEIGLLDQLSGQRLITNPAQGVLEYEPKAIKAILELSAGHPYFTQIICFALFGRARELQNWKVTCEDVKGIVDKVIESAGGGLPWFWDGLSIPERVVISAVAETQKIAIETGQRGVPEDPLKLLEENYGIIQTKPLTAAAAQLVDKGFLDNTGRRVQVELVRHWLVQRYPLQQEIWELEKFEQEKVNDWCEEANKLCQQGKKQEALEKYQQVLELNPNHFSTIFVLAKEYLDEDFEKAVELYTRAHKVDPIRHKEGLLLSLEKYGDNLISQREFPRAKEQFNRVLEIAPDNVSAKRKLQEIAVAESGGSAWRCEGYRDAPHSPVIVARDQICPSCSRALNSSESSSQYRRKRTLLGGMAAAGIIALAGVGVSPWSTPCSAGEQKVLGITCVADPSINISRGERTLFPSIDSINPDFRPNRDHGVKAFKQGKYPEAAEYFKKAVAANPNDPEVLIYYNNALAQQQGSPLTLAAVVPVDKEINSAQEILRGVAQAQNQFNNSGGLNHRLLEIAIANDGNKQDKARKVAQELVNDSSILGVIGHDSSEATQAGLAEYAKASSSFLAIISPTSTSTYLTSNVFFRTVPSDAAAGEKLAEYAKSHRLDRVVIFRNPNPDRGYSNSLQKAFTNNFKQLGGTVAQVFDLGAPNQNLTETQKSAIARDDVHESIFTYNAKAALLFPDKASTSDALAIIKANADLNTNLNRDKHVKQRELKELLGGDALYSKKTLDEGKPFVNGLILAVPWFDEAPKSQDFSNPAEKRWGGGVSWRTATSFDATQAFIKALSPDPDPSRSTVLQELPHVNLSHRETSGEGLKFTPNRERDSKPMLVKVDGGKFITLPDDQ